MEVWSREAHCLKEIHIITSFKENLHQHEITYSTSIYYSKFMILHINMSIKIKENKDTSIQHAKNYAFK